ncbi:MAG: FKBP-type peptidyl-prolyl cis-trans isomerase, partial [Duncaniella sp.]|nr:FKBP-type peptidyl-prolyl cis-trans isomerase [Duncaniella sp.]
MAKQDYVAANRRWLEEKAQEEGVKPLDKGIFYKSLSKGKPGGASPNRNSVVTVHYTGRPFNGKK